MTRALFGVALCFLSAAVLACSFAAPMVQASSLTAPTSTHTPISTWLTPQPAACLPNSPLSLAFLPNSSFVNDILSLPDGGFLLRGRMDDSEGTLLAKIDPAGKILWQYVFGTQMGNAHLAANGNIVLEFSKSYVLIAPDGKVIYALNVPWYQPNADGGFTIITNQRVGRYKDPQTPLWQVEIKDAYGYTTTTSDGGAIFAYVGVYTDTSVYYAPQYTDIKVIKISPDGNAYQRVYGKLVGEETLDFVQSTNDGGALLAGTNAYEELAADHDIWLMKVNPSGGMSWQTTLWLPRNNETLQEIYSLKTGYLAVITDSQSYDPVLVWLTPNGKLSWQKIITSSRGQVEINAAASTTDGGILLAGETWEKTSVYWLAKLDSKGRLVWEKTLGFELSGEPDSEVMVINPLSNKQILLGGLTNQLGGSSAPVYSAWIAQIPDAGQPLGLINLLPGKFGVISSLGARPNTLPDEIITSTGAPLKEITISVKEAKLQPAPACLPSGAVYPTPAALPSLTPSVTPTLAFIRNLFLTNPSMQGDDVVKLQQRLFELGYTEVGARDGIFGRMTDTAVRNFQRRNNLEVDGYVGPKTWARLFGPAAVKAER